MKNWQAEEFLRGNIVHRSEGRVTCRKQAFALRTQIVSDMAICRQLSPKGPELQLLARIAPVPPFVHSQHDGVPMALQTTYIVDRAWDAAEPSRQTSLRRF